jgi:hypothetical protein
MMLPAGTPPELAALSVRTGFSVPLRSALACSVMSTSGRGRSLLTPTCAQPPASALLISSPAWTSPPSDACVESMSKKSPLTPAAAPARLAMLLRASPCATFGAVSRSDLTAELDRSTVSTCSSYQPDEFRNFWCLQRDAGTDRLGLVDQVQLDRRRPRGTARPGPSRRGNERTQKRARTGFEHPGSY